MLRLHGFDLNLGLRGRLLCLYGGEKKEAENENKSPHCIRDLYINNAEAGSRHGCKSFKNAFKSVI